MGRRSAGGKATSGLRRLLAAPTGASVPDVLGPGHPSLRPPRVLCPLSSGPTEATALERYHPTLSGDASLVARDAPHLTQAAACRRACPLPGGPTVPVCRDGYASLYLQSRPLQPPSPEPEEPSKIQSCEKPSVAPTALLGSPHSEATRPALPCSTQGACARQGHLRQLGSHWAPAGDGWHPPRCCLPTGPSAPSPRVLLPAPPSNATRPRLWPTTAACAQSRPCLAPQPPAPAGSSWGPAG